MHKFQWSLNIQIAGGPRLATSENIEIDAYDSIKLDVENGTVDLEVELQPSGVGQVKALTITSDHYGSEVTYKVNDSASSPVALNQPLALMGAGAVSLLAAAPTKLFFSNELANIAVIEILIGRDATP